MSRRSRIVGFGSAGLLVLAGIACAVVFSGTLGQNLAFVLVALGLVLATSLVFYEVGLTEDRARAREERERRRAETEKERKSRSPARPVRRPLDRMRGRPRRLR
jgi:hypothetical protein